MVQKFNPTLPQPLTAMDPGEIRDNLQSLDTHHAGGAAPITQATTGRLWFDTASDTLKVFNGSEFVDIATLISAGLIADTDTDVFEIYLKADGTRSLGGSMTVAEGFEIDTVDLDLLRKAQSAENQLYNGSFWFDTDLYSTPPFWTVVGSPTVASTTSIFGTFGNSTRLDCITDEGLKQRVNIRGGRAYTLGVISKTLTPAIIAKIETDVGDLFLGTFTDFTPVERNVTFTPSDGATFATVSLLAGSAGAIILGYVSLHEGQLSTMPLDPEVVDATSYDEDAIATSLPRMKRELRLITLSFAGETTKTSTFTPDLSKVLGAKLSIEADTTEQITAHFRGTLPVTTVTVISPVAITATVKAFIELEGTP